MPTRRLTPPNEPVMPAAATGPMPLGDAQDPPVDALALAAREIGDLVALLPGPVRTAQIQIRIAEAINEALDRCQALGGRRTR
ncbi:hypothetical protein ABZT49_31785 [Methylobacterium sp. EM32]|uniref:hypothetical protein n=1 Tax=Methylobacterium sp. EM32 TaxID=3163481 RepID=UPI0033A5BCF6